ncbi:dihydroxy-acid dehydratase [Blastopirellula sp. J2-11]|uniref:dihydroxy-acid dehydratase n=1 Tax=Blastopirellula sp. J2-11 TaxID=2943192 RepID=UPI0021C7E00A|nr:dihydroxy-acid dehydratase [Blastopirellula sp. J2-11]UUO08084.1 dihydroxy-acid dehydratase [Blastopirellula sp. J2-11]
MSQPLNWNSRRLTRGWQKGITAFYYGLGLTDADFDKPQIGIGVPLLDGNLCNVHAYQLGQELKAGCEQAGLIGFPFGTPAVSDNITQGHEGGNASLPSRNMIANAAECVVSAHGYDFLIGLHNCDKNGPGFAMALARLNYPGLIVNGGSIKPGCHLGRDTSILDVYDAQAAASVGAMTADEADQILRTACPGPGGCGIAASFNTWGIAIEAIGLGLPYSSSIPAEDPAKREECRSIGQAVKHLLTENIRPRDILTKKAFENAAAVIAAVGGSTNGVLHLIALAQEAEVDFTLRDLQRIVRNTPVLCSFAPRGKRTMYDLHKLGGTPMLLKYLISAGIVDGSCLTVSGKSLADNVADAAEVPQDQDLIAPLDKPFKEYADMQICFGNLAPGGVVFKVSSMRDPKFSGKAICFSEAKDIVDAVEANKITPGTVIVLRYLGPVASGMPEVLVATAALAVPHLDGKVAFLSDTRVSGVSHGAIGVHCAPEAAVGGPIALVEDGDEISFDLLDGDITLHVGADELATRAAHWKSPDLRYKHAYLADFAATVSQADSGCVSKAFHDVS